MNRITYEISELLSGITGTPDEAGYDISVSKIYDDIKTSRFEEDASVSFGIWEHELKKADWELTEKLCVDALKTKSKDFQILAWLIETLVVLDGLSGIVTGMQILNEFSKTFWSTGYPRTPDNASDIEQKIRICEWIFDVVAKKSKFMPFSNEDKLLNLYQYEYALDLHKTVVQSPNSSANILELAKQEGHSTLDEINNKIKVMESINVEHTLNLIQDIRKEKTMLDKTFSDLEVDEISVFSGLIKNLETIERILTRRMTNETKQDTVINSLDMTKRDEIYNSISELSKQLSAIEKHSPSSFMLDLVVSWKHKNLLEIMDDLKSGNSEAHRLLKFLIN